MGAKRKKYVKITAMISFGILFLTFFNIFFSVEYQQKELFINRKLDSF